MATVTDPTRTDPTDPLPPEEFSSWQSALEESILKPEQIAVLQTMVDEGDAKALDDAASILDLQEIIIHPPEHMWGILGNVRLSENVSDILSRGRSFLKSW